MINLIKVIGFLTMSVVGMFIIDIDFSDLGFTYRCIIDAVAFSMITISVTGTNRILDNKKGRFDKNSNH